MSDDTLRHVPLDRPYARSYVDPVHTNSRITTVLALVIARLLDDRERLAIALEHALVPLGAIDIGVTWELHPDLKAAVRDAVVLALAALSDVRGIR